MARKPQISVEIVDEDGTQLGVDANGIKLQGSVAHDATISGNPVAIGGEANATGPSMVGVGDLVRAWFQRNGALTVVLASSGGAGESPVDSLRPAGDGVAGASLDGLVMHGVTYVEGPDNSYDQLKGIGDTAPAIGALKVGLAGGDMTLRASAAISTASGTGTALDSVGWIKSFVAHLDVTTVRTGGSTAKLDVYIQTQLPSADWQDIVRFTQVAQTVTHEIVAWGPVDGNFAGIGAEGSAITYDRFFAEQDAGMTAANMRVMPLGDSMRVKWVYTAGDSSGGDYTFALVMTAHG
tara:strand:+ start:14012 stop:14896 length:885 start_codon:yes stop_codon:yes gene_type:complete